jgi:hypothetical protein
MAAPPVAVGAANETVALALPATTEVTRGAPGTVEGTAAEEAADAPEKLTAFLARTLNV